MIIVTLNQLDLLVNRLGFYDGHPARWSYKQFFEGHNIDLVLENREYCLKFPTNNDELIFRITHGEVL